MPDLSKIVRVLVSPELDIKSINLVAKQIQAGLNKTGENIALLVEQDPRTPKNIKKVNDGLKSIRVSAKRTDSDLRSLTDSMAGYFVRFSAFTLAASSVFAITRSISDAQRAALNFDRQLVRVAQVSDGTRKSVGFLSDTIFELGKRLGSATTGLFEASVTLSQAGFSARETEKALEALAKADLAPTFGSLTDTVQGLIAILNQFNLGVEESEKALSSINAVAAAFPVEAEGIVAAVRKAGGVFSLAGGSLEEFLGLFTAIQSTTRESADTIGVGLRTIITRLQDVSTTDLLANLGIRGLRDEVTGELRPIGEVFQQLANQISDLSVQSGTFAQIVKALGGRRQASRVIPILTNFDKALEAQKVAVEGVDSLSEDAVTAQQALEVQFNKTRAAFEELLNTLTQDENLRGLLKTTLSIAKSFAELANTIEPILPLLAGIGAIKLFPRAVVLGTDIKNKVAQFNTGGFNGQIPGNSMRDDRLIAVAGGEYVIRNKAVKKYGTQLFDNLNEGKYNSGGFVGYQTGGEVSGFSGRTKGDINNEIKRLVRTRNQLLQDMQEMSTGFEKAIKNSPNAETAFKLSEKYNETIKKLEIQLGNVESKLQKATQELQDLKLDVPRENLTAGDVQQRSRLDRELEREGQLLRPDVRGRTPAADPTRATQPRGEPVFDPNIGRSGGFRDSVTKRIVANPNVDLGTSDLERLGIDPVSGRSADPIRGITPRQDAEQDILRVERNRRISGRIGRRTASDTEIDDILGGGPGRPVTRTRRLGQEAVASNAFAQQTIQRGQSASEQKYQKVLTRLTERYQKQIQTKNKNISAEEAHTKALAKAQKDILRRNTSTLNRRRAVGTSARSRVSDFVFGQQRTPEQKFRTQARLSGALFATLGAANSGTGQGFLQNVAGDRRAAGITGATNFGATGAFGAASLGLGPVGIAAAGVATAFVGINNALNEFDLESAQERVTKALDDIADSATVTSEQLSELTSAVEAQAQAAGDQERSGVSSFTTAISEQVKNLGNAITTSEGVGDFFNKSNINVASVSPLARLLGVGGQTEQDLDTANRVFNQQQKAAAEAEAEQFKPVAQSLQRQFDKALDEGNIKKANSLLNNLVIAIDKSDDGFRNNDVALRKALTARIQLTQAEKAAYQSTILVAQSNAKLLDSQQSVVQSLNNIAATPVRRIDDPNSLIRQRRGLSQFGTANFARDLGGVVGVDTGTKRNLSEANKAFPIVKEILQRGFSSNDIKKELIANIRSRLNFEGVDSAVTEQLVQNVTGSEAFDRENFEKTLTDLGGAANEVFSSFVPLAESADKIGKAQEQAEKRLLTQFQSVFTQINRVGAARNATFQSAQNLAAQRREFAGIAVGPSGFDDRRVRDEVRTSTGLSSVEGLTTLISRLDAQTRAGGDPRLAVAAEQAVSGLKKLADTGTRTADILTKINTLESSRAAKRGLTEKLLFADPRQKREILQRQATARSFVQSGADIRSLATPVQRAVIQGLREAGSELIRGGGGRTADELANRAIDRLGGLDRGPEARAIERERRKALEIGAEGVEANKFLAERELSILNDHFTSFNKEFGANIERLLESFTGFPSEIAMHGNHNVNVNINGAQILSTLEPSLKNLVTSEIEKGINKFRQENLPNAKPFRR